MGTEEATDSRERIMEATYEALIETGYADLTMTAIAEKSATSTGLLHYHFDTKEDLLVAFLDDIIERLEERFADAADGHPVDRLHELLSLYVLDPTETDRQSFHIALVELRSQAPYNERYRARFQRTDELFREELAAIVRDGIEAGAFEPVDPDELATLLVASGDGARTRAITLGDPSYTRDVLAALEGQVLADVFTADARDRWAELVDG